MGLKKTHNTGQGFTAPNAYHRITDVWGSADGNVNFDLQIFYDQDARLAGMAPIENARYTVPSTLKSRISVAYELYEVLKEEAAYLGAVDVFEPGTFPQLVNQDMANSYILHATLEDGYSVVGGAITNANLTGKCILNGQVVTGTFTKINAQNVVADGYSVMKIGYIDDGYADGYIVQNITI